MPADCSNCCSRPLCEWYSCKTRTPRPKATPVPRTKLLVVCSALFVNQFGVNMIFPFLPFMIHDFFPYLDKTELGRKAGYLGSSYYVGNFVGNMLWGWIADRLGRRPVLLMGVTFTIACELFFGFSQNFAWAIMARLMWGLLNGNIGVVKTYISEISDSTNQAKGFAAVGTSAGIARLLGSVLGGFLAQPASKYSFFEVEFFCKYPYSLPCIVGGSISLFSVISTWLFLDETLVKQKGSSIESEDTDSPDQTNTNSSDMPCDSGIEIPPPEITPGVLLSDEKDKNGLEVHRFEMDEEMVTDDELASYDVSPDTELLRNAQKQRYCNLSREKCLHRLRRLLIVRRVMDCAGGLVACVVCLWTYEYSKCKLSNLRGRGSQGLGRSVLRKLKLVLDRRILSSILLYGIIALLSTMSNELFPLLLVTDYEHGGYSMDTTEIGIILMVAAIVQLNLQFFVFPRITKCFGCRHTYKIGCVFFGMTSILLPLSNRISGPTFFSEEELFSGNGSGNRSDYELDYCGNSIYSAEDTNSVSRIPARVWAVIMPITVMMVFSRMITITSITILISNSTLPATRGTVNGFSQSTAALGRMLGPVTAAPIFAWSETSGKGWPLNYHLMFDLLAVGSFVAFLLCFLLPASAEKKREDSTASTVHTEKEIAQDDAEHSHDDDGSQASVED